MAKRTNVPARVDELLVARATEGLSPTEQRELARLLAGRPEMDADVYERAAAAVCLAALSAPGAMPRGVRERLARSAAALVLPPVPPRR
jgi:hypothetical protein